MWTLVIVGATALSGVATPAQAQMDYGQCDYGFMMASTDPSWHEDSFPMSWWEWSLRVTDPEGGYVEPTLYYSALARWSYAASCYSYNEPHALGEGTFLEGFHTNLDCSWEAYHTPSYKVVSDAHGFWNEIPLQDGRCMVRVQYNPNEVTSHPEECTLYAWFSFRLPATLLGEATAAAPWSPLSSAPGTAARSDGEATSYPPEADAEEGADPIVTLIGLGFWDNPVCDKNYVGG